MQQYLIPVIIIHLYILKPVVHFEVEILFLNIFHENNIINNYII